MERLSDTAIEIINELHTERLDYSSEYIPLIDAANLLAAYEDTCLEPEDLKKAFNESAILKLAAQALSTTPDHLRELVKAERDGRMVLLPCKVGDDVWFVRKFGKKRCIKRAEVSCINIDFRGEVFVSARRISGGYIGKTVFLTREEAEAALKGGEG